MRLDPASVHIIREQTIALASEGARVAVFGSRTDPVARGGDVDLLVEVPGPVARPAELAARLAARLSRSLDGRRVDVLLSAPNLRNDPIHHHARREGVWL